MAILCVKAGHLWREHRRAVDGRGIRMNARSVSGCIGVGALRRVATTMSDPSLPLTVTEYEEWGDPNKKDVFEYILSYSPYDQGPSTKTTPPYLSTAGLNDPRVSYWEPRNGWPAFETARQTTRPYCSASTWVPVMGRYRTVRLFRRCKLAIRLHSRGVRPCGFCLAASKNVASAS